MIQEPRGSPPRAHLWSALCRYSDAGRPSALFICRKGSDLFIFPDSCHLYLFILFISLAHQTNVFPLWKCALLSEAEIKPCTFSLTCWSLGAFFGGVGGFLRWWRARSCCCETRAGWRWRSSAWELLPAVMNRIWSLSEWRIDRCGSEENTASHRRRAPLRARASTK